MEHPELIWHNGELKPWADATTHVMAHALHYGSSVFEGIRVYDTPEGPAVFRLQDHLERLFDSAKLYRMPMPYDLDTLRRACHQAVSANGLKSAYLRPIAFRGAGTLGLLPKPETPTEVAVAAMHWGTYLGEEALEQGVEVCISSWSRIAPNTLPAMAKAGGQYLSSQLISMEAHRLGFSEGIALGIDGRVSEGAGENLFMVKHGVLMTPPVSASLLAGITRNTIMQLARAAGVEVVEQAISREALYLADELFFTGTAAEVTPIRAVDDIQIGAGRRGPLTEQLQSAFFGLFDGSTADDWNWLEAIVTD